MLEARAVLSVEEGLQRPRARRHADEIIITQREDGVDDVMADALIAEVDFEAVGEEGEEVRRKLLECFD